MAAPSRFPPPHKPGQSLTPAIPAIPGRTAGFVVSISTALSALIPLVCVPLGIIAVVLAVRALLFLRRSGRGSEGRGLIIATLVIAGVALAVTVTLAVLAIPVVLNSVGA